MVGKELAGAAVGSLLGGAALFELISPTPPSKAKLGGVTIQGQPPRFPLLVRPRLISAF